MEKLYLEILGNDSFSLEDFYKEYISLKYLKKEGNRRIYTEITSLYDLSKLPDGEEIWISVPTMDALMDGGFTIGQFILRKSIEKKEEKI